jgi:hypothetical protein
MSENLVSGEESENSTDSSAFDRSMSKIIEAIDSNPDFIVTQKDCCGFTSFLFIRHL